jgi:Tfp pilus assembly protein PilF
MAKRQWTTAEPHLTEAIALDPDHTDARVALAEVYRRSDRPRLASQMLRDAFDRSGEDADVGKRLVVVLLEAGDRDGALELLGTLDADWRGLRTRIEIGYLYLSLRHAEKAIQVADAVLVRDATYEAARVLKARALGQARRRADAVKVALEIRRESSEHAEGRALAAELLGKDGKLVEALALIDEALRAHPRNPTLLVEQAALHERGGDLARARTILDQALLSAPENEDVRFARAAFEDRVGDPERAVAIMWPLYVADPDNVMALNFIGYSYAQRKIKLAESERMLRRAIELTPEDGFVLDSLGLLLSNQGKLDEALVVLQRADRLAPEEPEILLHLGEVLVARGEHGRARDLFHRALTLEPDEQLRSRLEERVRTLEAQAKP